MNIGLQLLPILGSFASIFGVFLSRMKPGESLSFVQGLFLGIGACFLILAVFLSVRNYASTKPITMKKGPKVQKYMYNWIENGGKVAILSNDMSWVVDDKMKNMLHAKARNDELDLCLPKEIPLSRELKESGASVHTFQEIEYIPESRFTIINRGRLDAQVAVGRSKGQMHMIEEFSQGQHPVFNIANDLINMLIKYDALR